MSTDKFVSKESLSHSLSLFSASFCFQNMHVTVVSIKRCIIIVISSVCSPYIIIIQKRKTRFTGKEMFSKRNIAVIVSLLVMTVWGLIQSKLLLFFFHLSKSNSELGPKYNIIITNSDDTNGSTKTEVAGNAVAVEKSTSIGRGGSPGDESALDSRGRPAPQTM